MSSTNQKGHAAAAVAETRSSGAKLIVVALIALAAFLLSYNYAVAQSNNPGGSASGSGLFAAPAGGGGCAMSGGASGGGGCCGGGGAPVEGATVVEGDIQRIAVDTSAGSFNPNVIKAKAGVPIRLEFSQAPGGCLSGVYFPDFGVNEDLTGGPKAIELPALAAGEYDFYCQMQMVSAKIVVE